MEATQPEHLEMKYKLEEIFEEQRSYRAEFCGAS